MNEDSTLSPEDERELATDLARQALARTAPEELLVFDDVADEYFVDPDQALVADSRDEAVGFGLDLAMLTPALLAVAVAAVRAVAGIVSTAATQEGIPVARRIMRRMFGLEKGEATSPPSVQLTTEELKAVRRSALDRGVALGLAPDQAGLLADAIVGGLETGQ